MKIKLHELPQKWREEANSLDDLSDYAQDNYAIRSRQWAKAAAELEAALADQWQPIETYPKNGKEFMCIDTDGNIDIQAHPMVPAPEEYTHWMPLPAPPMSDK